MCSYQYDKKSRNYVFKIVYCFLVLLDDQTERFLNLRKKIWDNITEGEYVQYHFCQCFLLNVYLTPYISID